MSRRSRFLFLFGLFLLIPVGCRNSVTPPEDDSMARMSKLAEMLMRSGGPSGGIEDEAAFREFIAGHSDRIKRAVAVKDAGELLVCARDGQPVKLLLGKDCPKYEGRRIRAYEQSAVDGQVWVVLGNVAEQIPEDKLKKLLK